MKIKSWGFALAAILVSGCAQMGLPGKDDDRPYVPTLDRLTVTLGKSADGSPRLVVMPPVFLVPVVPKKEGQPFPEPAKLVWRLSKEGPLKFSGDNGIVIEGEIKDPTLVQPLKAGEVTASGRTDRAGAAGKVITIDPKQDEIGNCKVSDGGYVITCENKRSRPGVFKYTIRVRDQSNEYVLDPWGENW